jgi:hypothetical protein
VPPVLESLTGLRIDQLLDRLRGAAAAPVAAEVKPQAEPPKLKK